MGHYKLVVMTQPVEGREAEFNDWYQNTHLGDVTAVPGIDSAQRYKLTRVVAAEAPHPYLAIYDVETDDPDAVLAEMRARANTDRMVISDALGQRMYAAMYEVFGERVTG